MQTTDEFEESKSLQIKCPASEARNIGPSLPFIHGFGSSHAHLHKKMTLQPRSSRRDYGLFYDEPIDYEMTSTNMDYGSQLLLPTTMFESENYDEDPSPFYTTQASPTSVSYTSQSVLSATARETINSQQEELHMNRSSPFLTPRTNPVPLNLDV